MRTGRLNVARISKTTSPGRYADGGCVYLVVTSTGAKQWVARLTIHGKQMDFGLGGISYVTLAEAREEAAKLRKVSRTGGDPRIERKWESLTFSDAARRVHAMLRPTWKNEKHAETWLATVETYVNPVFGALPIKLVGTSDILRVLSPIWTEKHETAKRLRQRISTVFDWAKGAGHYPHENPVNGIKKALPTVKRHAEHMAALPWQDVHDFVAELETRPGVSARALEFIILTAARSGEARGARWSEISNGTWTVPAERMKRSIEHRVPLSPDALRVRDELIPILVEA